MKSRAKNGSRPQRNAEVTRAAIMQAALAEFAAEGVEGARIDQIARAAKVNKALLYYYFKDKERLYGAVLDHVFGGLFLDLIAALEREVTPTAKVLSYVKAHFDFVAGAPLYPRLVMREMMRAGRKPSPHLLRIFREFATPFYALLKQAIQEGIRRGEFRPVDPDQTIISLLGVVVFYFASSPGQRILNPEDPLGPDQLANRRRHIVEFVSHALLQSPKKKAGKGPAGKSGRRKAKGA